jgi:mycothiol synthase
MTTPIQLGLKSDRLGGAILRTWAGEVDFSTIAEVINDSMAADGLDILRDVESIRNYLTLWPNIDPRKDAFLIERDGRAIAYGDATWNDYSRGERVYRADMYMRPEARGSGLLEMLFRTLVDRLTTLAQSHVGVTPKVLQVSAGASEHALVAMLEAGGFKPARHFFRMVRPSLDAIPDLALPEGLEVRPIRPEHFRAVFEARDEAFRDHWGHRPGSEEDYQRWIHDPEFQPQLWIVAWDGDQVAGMVLNFIDPQENERYHRARGYTEDISVRRPWRRRGLARALIALSLKTLANAGMTEAGLGVDSENATGALQLYESLGYQTTWHWAAYRKPFDV